MLGAYEDVDEHSNFDHYFDDFESVSSSKKEFQNELLNSKNVIAYGLPTCNKDQTINTLINKHNENYDGTHYHHFLITKSNRWKKHDKVDIRLFHSEQYFHTIESKRSTEYCLDTAYKSNNTKGKIIILMYRKHILHDKIVINVNHLLSGLN